MGFLSIRLHVRRFFRRILSLNSHQNPFLYLKGIHLKELQNVLNFMYHGEVNVAQVRIVDSWRLIIDNIQLHIKW